MNKNNIKEEILINYNIMCSNKKEVLKCLNIFKKLGYKTHYDKEFKTATLINYDYCNDTFSNTIIAEITPGCKNISYYEFIERILDILLK